ncbi:MAG: FAD-binding oxidoreductase [Pseudomonadota bacterium]
MTGDAASFFHSGMIQNERPVIADSLWTATANPTPACPPLDAEIEAEVCIVGGGFTGLSAALHLAEAGASVAVLEAETPGWGASGRNGGQVNPGLIEDPDVVTKTFGDARGRRMVAMSGGAGSLVFSLIEKHGIKCEAMPVGWLRAAHDAKALEGMRARVAQWAGHGAELRLLSRDETAEMIGTDVYAGGTLDPRGGNVHPLNYALGLADAALRNGACIFGHSRALNRERMGDRWLVRTARGAVAAKRVLICTNAYTDGFAPDAAKTVVPIRSVQVATRPLSDNIAKSIIPGGHSPSDTRRLLLYYRKDALGRFIMGGRGAYDDSGAAAAQEALRRISVELFPQLADAEWAHSWGGFVAATPNHFPNLHLLEEGVLAGLGYNGRGVAMATAMGKVMADWALGRPDAELDYPVTPLRPMPFHRFHRLGVNLTVARMRLMDRLGL